MDRKAFIHFLTLASQLTLFLKYNTFQVKHAITAAKITLLNRTSQSFKKVNMNKYAMRTLKANSKF